MSYKPALAYSRLKCICQPQLQSYFQLASQALFREKKNIAFKFSWLMGFGILLNVYGRGFIITLSCNPWRAVVYIGPYQINIK